MTNEFDRDEEVPHLVEQLEGSLLTPGPESIRAGSQQRQSARKRMLAGAGVFVAALAITGAITFFNQDEPVEVTTADTTELANDDSEPGEAESTGDGSVADDSPPRQILAEDVPLPNPAPFPATVSIDECANGSTISAAGEQWLAWELPPEWEGAGSVPVTVVIADNTLLAMDVNGLTAPFVRNDGQTRIQPCIGFTYQQPLAGTVIVDPDCSNLTSVIVGDEHRFSNSAIPSEWQFAGTVEVTAEPIGVPGGDQGFLATDPNGFSASFRSSLEQATERGCLDWFGETTFSELDEPTETSTTTTTIVVERAIPDLAGLEFNEALNILFELEFRTSRIEEASDTVKPGRIIRTEPAAGTVLEQRSVVTIIVSSGPDESLPSSPPSFAPTSNVALTGNWELVSLWQDGEPVGLSGFFGDKLPTIGIFGRQLSGYDGCNSHGSGLFFAKPDGSVRLEGGVTTLVGCQSEAIDTFSQGTFGANQWGKTPGGNLVLTNGSVVTEFALVETNPAETIVGLSVFLDTIWGGNGPSDYDNLGPDEPDVQLAVGQDSAVLTTSECGEYLFAVERSGSVEGTISFESVDQDDPSCELSPNELSGLEGLLRANYFAADPSSIILWDGPNTLVQFVAERE